MKKEEIKLEDLIPVSSMFKLAQFKDFEFNLRPCTGSMLISMSEQFGDVLDLIKTPSVENISKIAMSLMEHESAVKFKKQKVKFIDVVTGDENEMDVGGYSLLMQTINGLSEQYAIYEAILVSFGYGKKQSAEMIKGLKAGVNKMVSDSLKDPVKKKKKKKKKTKTR